ncbi:alpha/beta hydrolase [Rubrivivax gelatinosus]|nr:alpha/beta hydrolase [Rubrivivax gelatinosus]
MADEDRFVHAAGLRWHVVCSGQGGGTMLLLHGTGASAHSMAALMRLLGGRWRLVAPDLPGHGDTSRPTPEQLTLPGMAAAVGALLQELDCKPEVIVGHSAGAAIAVQMVLAGLARPSVVVSINGAFLPYGGRAAALLSPLARLLYAQTWISRLFARRAADPAVVRRLIEGTGSHLDAAGVAAYQALMVRPAHAEAALGMMAHWDLSGLARELRRFPVPLWLIAGLRDRAVRPAQAREVAARCPQALLLPLPGLGHLAHEESPEAVARLLEALPVPAV